MELFEGGDHVEPWILSNWTAFCGVISPYKTIIIMILDEQ
jgi:hypothetical protein